MNGLRVLVTGASGFTGKYVCNELKKRGCCVFGLARDCSVSGKSIDLNDKNALSLLIKRIRPEAVVHLAAISYVGSRNVSDFKKVNVDGTVNLLQALSIYGEGLKCVLVASSANIYGNVSTTALPISEATPPNPVNDYARSKLWMEIEIERQFKHLPVTIVRPFNYTGVGQSDIFLVPKIVKAFKNKTDCLELGNLNVSRDFSDVRFVAWVYASLVEKQIAHKVINVCSGKLTSISEIICICEQLTKHKIKILSSERFKRDNEISQLYGDPSFLQEVLGRYKENDFKKTLQWMLA